MFFIQDVEQTLIETISRLDSLQPSSLQGWPSQTRGSSPTARLHDDHDVAELDAGCKIKQISGISLEYYNMMEYHEKTLSFSLLLVTWQAHHVRKKFTADTATLQGPWGWWATRFAYPQSCDTRQVCIYLNNVTVNIYISSHFLNMDSAREDCLRGWWVNMTPKAKRLLCFMFSFAARALQWSVSWVTRWSQISICQGKHRIHRAPNRDCDGEDVTFEDLPAPPFHSLCSKKSK